MVHEVGEDVVVGQHDLDPVGFRSRGARTVVRGGRERTVRWSVRSCAPSPELRDRLRQAGSRDVQALGEDGAPLTREHRRRVVTARSAPRGAARRHGVLGSSELRADVQRDAGVRRDGGGEPPVLADLHGPAGARAVHQLTAHHVAVGPGGQ